MKVAFQHYLHGNKEAGWDFAEELAEKHGLTLTEDQKKSLAYSFYEVTLHCVLDTSTLEVTIVGAE